MLCLYVKIKHFEGLKKGVPFLRHFIWDPNRNLNPDVLSCAFLCLQYFI